MNVLHLILTYHWYDMIDSGEKKEEYREITPYWLRRLIGEWAPDADGAFDLVPVEVPACSGSEYSPEDAASFARNMDECKWSYKHGAIVFHRGYAADAKTMAFIINDLSIREGKLEWGATPGKKYFVFSLGARINPWGKHALAG